jgi:hypothetical protein
VLNQENSIGSPQSRMASSVVDTPGTQRLPEPVVVVTGTEALPSSALFALKRVTCFFVVAVLAAFLLNAAITSGLRSIRTSQYGVSNDIMAGRINAEIVVTGSSRALSHYDPRIIEQVTGRSAFNIGRNGSQTDMQVAVLKAYLEHNRAPKIVIHNLDAFSFVTTREVYAPAQYVPYLYDPELYKALRKINPNTWKSRYVPLYGYVADDMNMAWIEGLAAHLGWSPRQDFFLGFNPRQAKWTEDFERFKAANPDGVSWPIEPAGIQDLEDLARLCQQRGIRLIFVYSPEYRQMQKLTNNRKQVFDLFRELSIRYGITFWDYSDWEYTGDEEYFTNSQHLNAEGAALFSRDLARRLQAFLVSQAANQTAALPAS